jgi:hypothetical protein
MLYARCSTCGYTAALTCSGSFLPHPPVPVAPTGSGAACPRCGPLPPVFTCPFFHTQYLYLPGSSPAPQPGYSYAPVVQAPAGASPESVGKAFAKSFGQGLGSGLADAFFGGNR